MRTISMIGIFFFFLFLSMPVFTTTEYVTGVIYWNINITGTTTTTTTTTTIPPSAPSPGQVGYTPTPREEFNFTVFPTSIEKEFDILIDGKIMEVPITVKNMEKYETMNVKWKWNSTILDFCELIANTSTKILPFRILPMSNMQYTLKCDSNLMIIGNPYNSTLLIYPEKYEEYAKGVYVYINTSISKDMLQMYPPTGQMNLFEDGKNKIIEVLNYPLICISYTCMNDNLWFPIGVWKGPVLGFIEGFHFWMLIAIGLGLIVWFKVIKKT